MPQTYLITGSSRSLGLGYCHELLKHGHRVVAAVRNPDTGADQLSPLLTEFGKDNLFILKCDVTDVESTKVAAKTLESSGFISSSGLDAVLANAGVLGGGWKTSTQL